MTEFVVTYRIEIAESNFLVEEFFRGDYRECLRIKQYSMSGGENDKIRTPHPWYPVVSPAREWDRMLELTESSDG